MAKSQFVKHKAVVVKTTNGRVINFSQIVNAKDTTDYYFRDQDCIFSGSNYTLDEIKNKSLFNIQSIDLFE